MHLQILLAQFCSFLVGLANALPFIPIQLNERVLVGLLGGENILPLPLGGTTTTPPATFNAPPTLTISPIESSRFGTTTEMTRSIMGVHASSSTSSLSMPTTTTDFSATFVMQTQSPPDPPDYSSNISPSSTPSTTGWIGDASSTPPAELTEWKIIGIGVITVTLIAILILSISFFDSWWGFLRSVTCGKRPKPEGKETMIADWEGTRKSWEFNLANEDGHRYPTLASVESVAKEKEIPYGWKSQDLVRVPRITTPELAYGNT